MKLKECVHGIIVRDKHNSHVGMIVGITNNASALDIYTRSEPNRAIPLVQWSHGGTSGIHPANIEKL